MEIEATYKGFIEDENDALLLLQATLDGLLKYIPRRPYEIERPYLISSGSVFVFVEEISGIKRWTDGVSWSPSRIAGKFLVYKELDKSVSHPILKKRAISDDVSVRLPPLVSHSSSCSLSSTSSASSSSSFSSAPSSSPSSPTTASTLTSPSTSATTKTKAKKYTGFIKKTMSVKYKDPKRDCLETWHLVSYYNTDDVKCKKLTRPTDSVFFQKVKPCNDLVTAMENTTLGNSSKNPHSAANSPSLSKVTAGSNYLPFAKKRQIYSNDLLASNSPPKKFASVLQPTIMPSTNPYAYKPNPIYHQDHHPGTPLHTSLPLQPLNVPIHQHAQLPFTPPPTSGTSSETLARNRYSYPTFSNYTSQPLSLPQLAPQQHHTHYQQQQPYYHLYPPGQITLPHSNQINPTTCHSFPQGLPSLVLAPQPTPFLQPPSTLDHHINSTNIAPLNLKNNNTTRPFLNKMNNLMDHTSSKP